MHRFPHAVLLLALVACGGKGNDAPADGTSPDPTTTSDPNADADLDGFIAAEDCDDTDPTVHPGAAPTCDGVDRGCDGVVDPPGTVAQLDADGQLVADLQPGAEGEVYINLAVDHTVRVCGTLDHTVVAYAAQGLRIEGADADARMTGLRIEESDAVVVDGVDIDSEIDQIASTGTVLRGLTVLGGIDLEGEIHLEDVVVSGGPITMLSDNTVTGAGVVFEETPVLLDGWVRNTVDIEGLEAARFQQVALMLGEAGVTLRDAVLTEKVGLEVPAFEGLGSLTLDGVELQGEGPVVEIEALTVTGGTFTGVGPFTVHGEGSVADATLIDTPRGGITASDGVVTVERTTFRDGLDGDLLFTLGDAAELTCIDCVVEDSTGFVLLHGLQGTLTLQGLEMRNNAATSLISAEHATLEDVLVESNESVWGTITLGAGSTVTRATVRDNVSDGGPAGLHLLDGVTVTDSLVTNNTSPFGSGGVEVGTADATTVIQGTTIEGNHGAYGGGLYAAGGALHLEGVVVTGNLADTIGGGLALGGGQLTLVDSEVSGNEADLGGGLHLADGSDATLGLDGSMVEANTARVGAGLFVERAGLSISGGTVDGNTATEGGGGIAYLGAVQLAGSAVGQGPVGNLPDDFLHVPSGTATSGLGEAVYTCDATGCAP